MTSKFNKKRSFLSKLNTDSRPNRREGTTTESVLTIFNYLCQEERMQTKRDLRESLDTYLGT